MSLSRPSHLALIATSVFCIGIGSAVQSEESPQKSCILPDPPGFQGLPVSRRALPPKREKEYPPEQRASRRIGLRPVTATFFNVHSLEALPVLEGRMPPQAVLDRFFRCRGFGKTKSLDPRLPATATAAAVHFNSPRIEVISAYRSPKFNDALAKKGRHVAAESRHTRGEALDFRLVTADAARVAAWLFEHFEGGVGTYTVNNFVHIDTGPKRRWRGR